MLYFEMASAEITIDGGTVFVETDNYEVQFDRGVMTYIHNKRTGETYTLPEDHRAQGVREQTGILRRHHGHIGARDMTIVEAKKTGQDSATLLFRQGGNEITLTIEVEAHTGDLLIRGNAVSDTAGVYGFQWGCGGLDIQSLELILPARGGQVINDSSPITNKGFNYPGDWEAQLAIIQGERGGFFFRGSDEAFRFKSFSYEKGSESFALHFATHNQAPWEALTEAKSITWRLNTYAGDWRVPAQQYRDWMERTYKPRRLSEMPVWVENIGLIVTYRGGLETKVLERLAEQIDPTKTLLYLTGWRRDRYDVNYPDYTAKEGFDDFVETAHQYGFRVMPHINLMGVSPYHPLYMEFQKFQFRSPWTGESLGWWWEQTETRFRHAFINPASSKFRNLLVQRLKEVWQEYQVDAFHLDVSHLVVNDANGFIEGLNAAQGNALLHKELAEAMPSVVFSGERLHEVTFFRESFAQRPKLRTEAKPHPISAFLFSPYTYPIGIMPNPDENPSLYQQHLASYENWGVLPTLTISTVDQLGTDRVETQRLLSIARTWQQLGLKPDFESDWGPETLFQYVGQGGEIATYQRTAVGSTLMLRQDGEGYERIFGVTQVQTAQNLPAWRAYNEMGLLGLNPKRSYLLSAIPRDFSQPHINSLPEGVSVVEARVTENAALFRLEEIDGSDEINLLSKLYLARTGIVLDGKEFPRQKGATFGRVETTIAGVRKEAIDAHPPWREGVSGDVFGEWMLSLPDSPSIRLEFNIGLPDNAIHSDGVTFVASLQGDEIFRQHYNERRWHHISLDLTRYRGQQVTLRLTTTPGPNEHTVQDGARWGEPKIVSEPVDIRVSSFLPRQPIKRFPDTVRYIGQKQYVLETKLPTQILFLFESAQQVVPPHNLREIQFVAGLQFEGVFLRKSAHGSGQRRQFTTTGVSKQSIGAHPPADGQTVIQFLLSLPLAQEITFSFSMGLNDAGCSQGVIFMVMLNGQVQLEHSTKVGGWVDAHLSLSEFAGETVLLELITDPDGNDICDGADWADLLITTGRNPDANLDGQINILDLILVASSFGEEPPSNPQADTNKDGVVNLLDLVFVAEHLSQNAAAPSQLALITSTPSSAKEVIAAQRALTELEAIPNKSHGVQIAIELLQHYLSIADRNVRETKLLPNYPNPFNPDTWIPYQLSAGSTVTVKIYDMTGNLVRTIEVGHKPVGYYLTRGRAIYWDGRNQNREPVSSGVYFYTLTAGDYTQTRRMVIVK